MNLIVVIAQIFVSILLIAVVLLQAKGSGLGSAWGGSGDSYHTRRGMEKLLFFLTFVFSIAFFVASIASFILF